MILDPGLRFQSFVTNWFVLDPDLYRRRQSHHGPKVFTESVKDYLEMYLTKKILWTQLTYRNTIHTCPSILGRDSYLDLRNSGQIDCWIQFWCRFPKLCGETKAVWVLGHITCRNCWRFEDKSVSAGAVAHIVTLNFLDSDCIEIFNFFLNFESVTSVP